MSEPIAELGGDLAAGVSKGGSSTARSGFAGVGVKPAGHAGERTVGLKKGDAGWAWALSIFDTGVAGGGGISSSSWLSCSGAAAGGLPQRNSAMPGA